MKKESVKAKSKREHPQDWDDERFPYEYIGPFIGCNHDARLANKNRVFQIGTLSAECEGLCVKCAGEVEKLHSK